MLDFDASKLLIIGVVALVVIGPKDLPRVLRQVGQAVTRLRRMAAEFQGQFMEAMKEADLQDLQKEVSKLKDSATLDVHFDPVRDVRNELSGALETKTAPPVALDPVADATRAVTNEAEAVPTPAMEPSAAPATLLGPAQDEGSAPAEVALAGGPARAEGEAFLTAADSSGGIGAPAPRDPSRRRKIVVPKRRPPGDRLAAARPGAVFAAPTRLILPPRRDDPRT